MEIGIIKTLTSFTKDIVFMFSISSMFIISLVGAFISNPKAWGLMGWIVIQIKSSFNTNKTKVGK